MKLLIHYHLEECNKEDGIELTLSRLAMSLKLWLRLLRGQPGIQLLLQLRQDLLTAGSFLLGNVIVVGCGGVHHAQLDGTSDILPQAASLCHSRLGRQESGRGGQ